MDGKVVLITGAAGTGKSTLVRTLLERARPFRRVDYGQLLREHKLRQTGVEISYDELRRDSAAVISPQDVAAVDEWLIGQLPGWRTEGNIVIDSHPVTKEVFGVPHNTVLAGSGGSNRIRCNSGFGWRAHCTGATDC
jgi:adenylate kinase